MPSTTQSAPFQHANLETDLGYAYVFSQAAMLLELQDRLNVLGLGVVPLMGDLASSGSDVLRVTDYGGMGWSLPMAALATETTAVTPSLSLIHI